MKPKEPIIFGKQRLVFNSAKNKYDNDSEISYMKSDINHNNYLLQNKSYSNSADSFNEYESDDTAVSNAIISRESNSNNLNLNLNAHRGNPVKFNKNENGEGFLGENKTPDVTKIYKEDAVRGRRRGGARGVGGVGHRLQGQEIGRAHV